MMTEKRALKIITRLVNPTWVDKHINLGGQALSDYNRTIIVDVFRAWFTLFFDIADHHSIALIRVYTWERQFLRNSYDLLSLIDAYAEIRDMLIRVTTTLDKRVLSTRVANICNRYGFRSKVILGPCMDLICKFCAESRLSPRYLQDVSSFLLFMKKLPLEDIGVEEKMLEAYFDVENKLKEFTFDEEQCNRLADIIHEWFCDLQFEDLKPFHGNGSTALGKMPKLDKYLCLATDTHLRKVYNLDDNIANEWFPSPFKCYFGLQRCSKMQFVPKTATKLRGISMEEPALLYTQQGLRVQIEQYVKKHKVLRNIIMFGNDAENRALAMSSSCTHSHATIDLSAASDSVSLKLIKKIFKKVPHLLWRLLATRSSHTLIPGKAEPYALNKFAPMGSALCFPVECIVFAAIVEDVYRTSRNYFAPLDSSRRKVFGDDIICDNEVADDVITALTKCGFTVNRDKSFFGDYNFRESCGGEYYLAVDVKPIYYRVERKSEIKEFASLAAQTHYTANYEYNCLRRHYIQRAMKINKRACFTADMVDFSKLYAKDPSNNHLAVNAQMSIDLQSDWRKYRGLVPRVQRNYKLTDRYAYFEYLRDHSGHNTPRQDVIGEPILNNFLDTELMFGLCDVEIIS